MYLPPGGVLQAPAPRPTPVTSLQMADEFDPQALVARFRDRAEAVKRRGLPPVEGAERRRFMEQAQTDFMDFAIIGDAEAVLEEGVLTLRVDLRPSDDDGSAP